MHPIRVIQFRFHKFERSSHRYLEVEVLVTVVNFKIFFFFEVGERDPNKINVFQWYFFIFVFI